MTGRLKLLITLIAVVLALTSVAVFAGIYNRHREVSETCKKLADRGEFSLSYEDARCDALAK